MQVQKAIDGKGLIRDGHRNGRAGHPAGTGGEDRKSDRRLAFLLIAPRSS